MKNRYNESTINRPWGDRPIDAPVVPVDIQSYIQQLMLEPAWQKGDRNAITVFKSDNITITIVALHKDAEVIPGNVNGTGIMQIQVLDGALHFKTGKDIFDINKGQMIVLHEHIPFNAIATEETVCLLTMSSPDK